MRNKRVLCAVIGSGLAALLALAAWLQPDTRGYGTHEQLGLGACSYAQYFKHRCPTCGMTTAWSNLLHANLGPALRANVCGTFLAMAAIVASATLLLTATFNKFILWQPTDRVIVFALFGIATLILIEWFCRLAFEGILRRGG